MSLQQQQVWLQVLSKALPGFQVLKGSELSDEQAREARLAIVANPAPDDLLRYPNLIWVQSLWAGVEKLVKSLPQQVQIVRLVDPNLAETMAEAVLAWTLYLHRDMPAYAQQQKDRVWRPLPVRSPSTTQVVVLGLGKLGLAACRRLQANGFAVTGWSRRLKHIEQLTCLQGEQGLKEAMGWADILVVLLPLTADTHSLLNIERLALLKPGACIINFARGAIIDTSGLVSCLNNGHVKHAVLDVFEQEPLPPEHPLWSQHGVTILPHISAPTNYESAAEIVAGNISNWLETGNLPETVSRQQGY